MVVLVCLKSITTNYFVHGKGNTFHSNFAGSYFFEKF